MMLPLRFRFATARRAQGRPGKRPRLSFIVSIAAATILLAAAADRRAAASEILHMRCTNPASGASWSIVVDLARNRVDSLAATITDRWISWRDPDRGFFDLERATGKLQLRNASSTGGYFLYYTCRRG